MASRTLQFGEHFFNYVAPGEDSGEDSPWCKNVTASCSKDEDEAAKDVTKDFFCDNCPKQFLNKTLLQLHRKTHIVVVSKCEKCDKVFQTKKRLSEHINTSMRTRTINVPNVTRHFRIIKACRGILN